MSTRNTIDVSSLPTFAFGHRPITWWATASMFVIEGTMFVVLMMTYFYLRTRTFEWPPAPLRPPDLFWGTLNTAIILVSCVPNQLAVNAAKKLDLPGVRRWMIVTLLFGLAFAVVRIFEFPALNCRWDQSAYGSIVFLNMGLHTVHVVTDVIDTIVLIVLMFVGPVEGRRFVDVSENGLYWYFVVAFWLAIYAVIYLAPRFT